MAAQIGDVAIRVGADIEPLKKGFKTASQKMTAFGRQSRQLAKSIAKIGAASAAAGAAIAAGLVNEGRKAIDTQAKLAKSVGASVSEIQALSRAAALSGVSTQQLERAMKSFNKRLGDAVAGTGLAKTTFERLGLSAKALADLPLSQRIALVADAVKQLDTAAERSSALDALMTGGRNLTNLFEGGSDAINKAAREVEGFGIALSNVEAAQVEAANDAVEGIGDALKGVRNQLTVALAPIIEEFGNQFTEAATKTGGFKEEIAATVETIMRGFGRAADVIQGIQVVIKGLGVAAAAFSAGFWNALRLIAEGVTFLVDGAINGVNRMIEAINAIPGLDDIELLASSREGDLFQGIVGSAQQAQANLTSMVDSLHQMAMEPLPSENIDAFFEAVKAKSAETAQVVTETRDKMFGGASEEEIQETGFGLRALEQEHLKSLKARDNWLSKYNQKGLKDAASTGRKALGVMAQNNRKAFELNKALSIADAIVSTYKGIAKAIADYSPPVSIAMAAAQAAMGFAQVAAIKSQTYGGGGGGGGGVVAGSGAAQAAASSAAASQSQSQQNQVVQINLEGEVFGRDQIRSLIGGINDALDDGYTLRI